ncbi:hypothetical protein TNCV_4901911 [Trichonephila clavipes]|nr:hypothetical protein TNCV_4901911 [Trichonephila clavipes]
MVDQLPRRHVQFKGVTLSRNTTRSCYIILHSLAIFHADVLEFIALVKFSVFASADESHSNFIPQQFRVAFCRELQHFFICERCMLSHLNFLKVIQSHPYGSELLILFFKMTSSPPPLSPALLGLPFGGYQPYGLTSILTGLESNRACVVYAWPTNCSPSTPSHLSAGTSEGIA